MSLWVVWCDITTTVTISLYNVRGLVVTNYFGCVLCEIGVKFLNVNLMFIGPCIIVIIEEWKTNLMSLAILFHFLCAQHASDINISTIRSLRLCWWITTSVVLFSVRCVLELLVQLVLGGVRFAGWSFSLQNKHHPKRAAPKAPTHNELRTRRPMW